MFHRESLGSVTVLRLAHGKANALDLEVLEGLAAELDAIAGDGGSALVLTAGGSIFSAGVDLFRVIDGGEDYVGRFLPALDRALERLFSFPRPVVAAVNGHAVAGGCILALACDYRIAARGKGKIGIPEQRVGVPFPSWPAEIVRFAVPAHQVQAMMHLGRTYPADEARERGLIDEAVEPEELLPRAVAAAGELGAIPAATFQLTKRQIRRPVLERVEASREINAEVQRIWASAETREVIRGYLEKTLHKGS